MVADLFHWGHVRFLKEAKALGVHLTVCVVPDERVGQQKRYPFLCTEERAEVVRACRFVDEVIIDGPKEITLEFMRQRGFDLYAFGAKDEAEGAQKLWDCRQLPSSMIKRIDYTLGVSSTQIVERIVSRFSQQA
jgi:cytidyltransferase-like protein